MKVLVTGGAGYIGCNLIALLAQRVDISKIGIYDNFSRNNYFQVIELKRKYGSKVEVFNGDILDSYKLKEVLQRFNHVVHLAAVTATPFSDEAPHLYEQVNHWGTASLVDTIDQLNHIESLIFLSSASVYGIGDNLYDEKSPVTPVNNYGKTKLRAEKQVDRLKNKIRVSICRGGTVYGLSSSTRFDSFINKALYKAMVGEKITIYGNGEQIRPIVHISKVINSLTNCLLGDQEGLSIINEYNLAVNDITTVLQSIFPHVEYLHVNRDVAFRTLSVKADGAVTNKDEILEKFKASVYADIALNLESTLR